MSCDFADEDLCQSNRKAFEILSLCLFWETIRGSCKVFIQREGENPESMDGVNDHRDHNGFFKF